jgi:hypothetical protein
VNLDINWLIQKEKERHKEFIGIFDEMINEFINFNNTSS